MPSLTITTRGTGSGPRYVVRYRLGGRAYPVEHGGSFRTMKDAKTRRDLIAGELAAGRNPRLALTVAEVPKVRTFADWAEAYTASRVDLADGTSKGIGSHLKAILPTFGHRDPETVTPSDVAEWIGGLGLKPGSIRIYLATLRAILDFAGVDSNPARDKRVKLPRTVTEEPVPPTARQFLALLDASPAPGRLPLVVLEQTAMRIGELASLEWGDVDVAESRFRLRSGETKTRRARWVQVPEWLMAIIEETCPFEDRVAERRVFLGYTEDFARKAMERACLVARIAHFHPHDLRHRRLSLWHGQGVPAKELAERAGHSKASMTLDVYSHVMPLDEVSKETLFALLAP